MKQALCKVARMQDCKVDDLYSYLRIDIFLYKV